jgi:hypothetical protein
MSKRPPTLPDTKKMARIKSSISKSFPTITPSETNTLLHELTQFARSVLDLKNPQLRKKMIPDKSKKGKKTLQYSLTLTEGATINDQRVVPLLNGLKKYVNQKGSRLLKKIIG